MTSSTTAQLRNILRCRQRRTESRIQVTCTESFVKFGHVVFDTCERTDRHTDTLIPILRMPPWGKVISDYAKHGPQTITVENDLDGAVVFCDNIIAEPTC